MTLSARTLLGCWKQGISLKWSSCHGYMTLNRTTRLVPIMPKVNHSYHMRRDITLLAALLPLTNSKLLKEVDVRILPHCWCALFGKDSSWKQLKIHSNNRSPHIVYATFFYCLNTHWTTSLSTGASVSTYCTVYSLLSDIYFPPYAAETIILYACALVCGHGNCCRITQKFIPPTRKR